MPETRTETREPERLLVAFDRDQGRQRLAIRLKTYEGHGYLSLTKLVRQHDKAPWTTKGVVSLRRGELKEASQAILQGLSALENGWGTEPEEQQQDDQQHRTAPAHRTAPQKYNRAQWQGHALDNTPPASSSRVATPQHTVDDLADDSIPY